MQNKLSSSSSPCGLLPYRSGYEKSKIMTNQEAADILKGIVNNMIYPIGSGKTGVMLRRYEAYAKAIKLLENTPD